MVNSPGDDGHDYYENLADAEYCYRCDNEGWIMACPDDMCRGAGECMHGVPDQPCPECNPKGEFDG